MSSRKIGYPATTLLLYSIYRRKEEEEEEDEDEEKNSTKSHACVTKSNVFSPTILAHHRAVAISGPHRRTKSGFKLPGISMSLTLHTQSIRSHRHRKEQTCCERAMRGYTLAAAGRAYNCFELPHRILCSINIMHCVGHCVHSEN